MPRSRRRLPVEGALEQCDDDIMFGINVSGAIVSVAPCSLPFRHAVASWLTGVGAEIIAECQVVAKGLSVQGADVKMVIRKLWRRRECLAAWDIQISLVPVSDRLESGDDGWESGPIRNHDVQIDNGLRRQAGNGSAADVLNRHGELSEPGGDQGSKLLEDGRPARIVVRHDNRLGHSYEHDGNAIAEAN